MPRADREKGGISDGLLRLSVGIESSAELWRDLSASIEATFANKPVNIEKGSGA
jgi:cystathionine beta-lyase/cystathionine gamma-synthase